MRATPALKGTNVLVDMTTAPDSLPAAEYMLLTSLSFIAVL